MPRERRCGQPRSQARSAPAAAASRTTGRSADSVAPPVSSPANAAPRREQQQHERRGDRAGEASDERVDRDLALEQVRDLEVGRADAVHHFDREAVGVERAARGEHDGGGGRGAQQQRRGRTRPIAARGANAAAARQLRDAATTARPGATACDRAVSIAPRSAPGSTSKLTSAGTGRSALCAGGPEPAFERRRISLSGTASAAITPGVARTACSSAVRQFAAPPGTSTE